MSLVHSYVNMRHSKLLIYQTRSYRQAIAFISCTTKLSEPTHPLCPARGFDIADSRCRYHVPGFSLPRGLHFFAFQNRHSGSSTLLLSTSHPNSCIHPRFLGYPKTLAIKPGSNFHSWKTTLPLEFMHCCKHVLEKPKVPQYYPT